MVAVQRQVGLRPVQTVIFHPGAELRQPAAEVFAVTLRLERIEGCWDELGGHFVELSCAENRFVYERL